MSKEFFLRFAALPAAVLLFAGCGTMTNGNLRGDEATLKPGWKRVGHAFVNALATPEVWIPAAGAVVIAATNTDKKISSYAIRKTPVFGSNPKAQKASNELVSVSNVVYWSSVLAAPGGDTFGPWIEAKLKLAAGGLAANTLAFQSTLALQSAVGRERPLHGTRNSFPSLHTSYAASQTMSAYCNFRTISMTPLENALARGAADAVPLATAWSRVEAGAHFPSDTLAGMSLASFLSVFVNDAFLGDVPVRAESDGRTSTLTYRLPF